MKRTRSQLTISVPDAPRKKRKTSQKRNPYNSRTLISRGVNGAPLTLRTQLKYTDTINLNPASEGSASYIFRANALYDPDYTATGHQPMGFDQLAVLYSRYTVTRMRMRMTLQPSTTSAVIGGTFGILCSDNVIAALLPVRTIMEQRNCGPTTVWHGSISAGNHNYVEYDLDVAKYIGNKSIVGEEGFSARTNVNPSRLIYAMPWFGNDYAISGTTTFRIDIVFDAVFEQPLELAPS